ncbi:GNAT family N-acetyltransferase [Methylibium sp.]|uniref:GNAT family N-acetyltransferase n=1 Tax=Methylibium sp. TaxID=2067992 RepID=UPI00286B3705|nr:GNAT family N-acetyltransferase [Methylibium sp.]
MSANAITIRRANPQDAAAFARIMGDAEVYPGLLQLPYPSEERLRVWLADMQQAGQPDLLLLAERGGNVVGSAGLHPAGNSLRRRHAMFLGLSVVREAQRLGVGSALMQALCDYADGWAHVLRLELTVYVDNVAAIALYRKFGFAVEGTHRAYALRDGAYVDAHAMARLHPRPPVLPSVA